ncbi:MAG: proline dehydrogenase family protein, partial [bacterium]
MIGDPSLHECLRALPDLGDPYADERVVVERLLALAPTEAVRDAARRRALRFVDHVRGTDAGWLSAQNLLASFPLASAEGVALLRLAEALLRVPDPETQTWLIAEKLASFRDARAGGDALVQRVLATALRLAGHTAGEAELNAGAQTSALRGWLARTTLRPLVIEGIRRFGEQFVFAQTLDAAVARAAGRAAVTEVHSYDMLGEGARSAADAQHNLDAYAQAIAVLGRAAQPGPWQARDGISVKLSAIHPRFETLQLERVQEELYPRLLGLAQAARAADINLTIDAEESERLVLQIALLDRLLAEPSLRGWEGLGLALQAYMPRALATVEHLLARTKETGRALAIRVVKGAYWDAEIKRAQELGMPGFPVYTRKWATDLSYLAIAQRLLASDAPVYPQFATHNALTVATLLELAQAHPQRRYEFQRLHGMGAALYAALHSEAPQVPVRVYAPVGAFRDLLAYLVRRLLENGANSSFVHQISDPGVAPAALVDDPVDLARQALGQGARLPALPTGAELFGNRANSRGLDVQHPPTLLRLLAATPPVVATGATAVLNPARLAEVVGGVDEADAERAAHSVAGACAAFA